MFWKTHRWINNSICVICMHFELMQLSWSILTAIEFPLDVRLRPCARAAHRPPPAAALPLRGVLARGARPAAPRRIQRRRPLEINFRFAILDDHFRFVDIDIVVGIERDHSYMTSTLLRNFLAASPSFDHHIHTTYISALYSAFVVPTQDIIYE